MKIRVDEARCVSAGQCAATSTLLFDQREEDGVVVLLKPIPSKELEHAAREAAMLCPAQAIIIEE